MRTFILCLLLFFTACKKDKHSDGTSGLRIKTEALDGGVKTYTYDPKGRVLKEQSTGMITDYKYEPGKITKTITQGVTVDSFVYELNAEGYIRSSRYNNEQAISYYEYKAGGLLTRSWDNRVNKYEAKYFYNAATGLLDSVRSTINNVWVATNVHSYFTDKVNTVRAENFGQAFYGDYLMKPLKTYTYKYQDGNAIKVQVSSNTYTYDNKGRIATRTFTNDGQVYNYSYTYY